MPQTYYDEKNNCVCLDELNYNGKFLRAKYKKTIPIVQGIDGLLRLEDVELGVKICVCTPNEVLSVLSRQIAENWLRYTTKPVVRLSHNEKILKCSLLKLFEDVTEYLDEETQIAINNQTIQSSPNPSPLAPVATDNKNNETPKIPQPNTFEDIVNRNYNETIDRNLQNYRNHNEIIPDPVPTQLLEPNVNLVNLATAKGSDISENNVANTNPNNNTNQKNTNNETTQLLKPVKSKNKNSSFFKPTFSGIAKSTGLMSLAGLCGIGIYLFNSNLVATALLAIVICLLIAATCLINIREDIMEDALYRCCH